MWEQRKALSLFLVFALLLNLFLPMSLVSATAGAGNMDCTSVTDDAYAEEQNCAEEEQQDPLNLSLLGGIGLMSAIKENIITSVKIYEGAARDDDGNVIPGVKEIDEIRPDQGALVWIEFKWELPEDHEYKAGDTFTFQLPDTFKTGTLLTGDLYGGLGEYGVTPEGEVTFIFNEEIEGEEVENGYFFIWRQFDENKFEGGTEQKVVFHFGGDTVTIPVHFKSKSNDEITKSGIANKSMNAGEINWVVDFNKGENSITNAVFEDELQAGLTIDMSSIEVYELEVQLDGRAKEAEPKTDIADDFILTNLAPAKNGFQINFGTGTIDKAYRVKYKTGIDEPIVADPYEATYENNVTVSGDELTAPLTKSAEVTVRYSKPLDKKSTDYKVVDGEHIITWAIQYNYNEQKIDQGNAYIEDSFDTTKHELVTNSFEVYAMTIDNNGNATRTTGTPPLTEGVGEDYTVTITSTGFTLQFNSTINSAYEIIYKTKAKDRIYDSDTVENEVEMHDGTKENATRDINQVIFWKNVQNVDYDAKTITWVLSLNDDEQKMENVVITDSYAGQGLTLLPDSLEISGLTPDKYTLTPDPDPNDPNDYSKGFKITFSENITTSHVIKYTTTFDPKKLPLPAPNLPYQYKNKATLEWEEPGSTDKYTNTKSATVDLNQYTKENGNKEGSYNAQTKEITWTIDVNYNLHEINNAVVRDFYTGKQTFVEGSLEVYHLNISDTGYPNGTGGVVSKGTLVSESDYTLTQPIQNDDGDDGFELILGEIKSAYRIIYKTTLEGHLVLKEYKNKATLYDESDPNNLLFDKSATVKPKHGGKYVEKSGKQGTGVDADFAFWTVNINRSQSQIDAGATLTDILSDNQILDRDSFELYETTVATDGTLTKAGPVDREGNYTLTFEKTSDGEDSFTLTFANALDRAYILEYKSFINADHGDKISNNASFEGQTSDIEQDDNSDFDADFSAGAGGGGSIAGKGHLKIIKVDAADDNVLEGAIFGLFDKSGNTLLEELVTDTNGEVEFKDYRAREYLLKELSAPSGYLVDAEYENGKVIKFIKDKTEELIIENTKGNWDFELTKVDQDENSKRLADAVFKLQKKNASGAFEDVAGQTNLTTNANGKIYLADLEPGEYQLIEIEAPKGYKLDQRPITFTIKSNQTKPETHTMENEINIGSVELVKVDDVDGTSLEGAEFELQDADGHVVVINSEAQTGLKTDGDGRLRINNLRAGKYQFVETKAPEYYQLNSTLLEFEIVEDGVLVTLEPFENKLIPGSVKLIKIRTNQPDTKLEGAEFTLQDANGLVVKDKDGNEITRLTTNENGEIVVHDLRPGDYKFVETKAPAGYYLGTEPIEFTIERSQQEILEVTSENRRRPSGGGGGGGGNPPEPEEEPEKPEEDPEEPVDPETPEEPETPVNPEEPVDPETPVNPEQPREDGETDEQGVDNATGNVSEHADEDSDSLNKDSHRLADSDAQATQNKKMLPKTGESLPWTPFLGVLLLIASFLLWFRKGSIQS